MAKTLMIQGTGSGAGKSLLVAALCRIMRDSGFDVAPFKSQNMALNSYITTTGGEIGRAQALQAEAAKLDPTVDMNPILLKAQGESGCQVIIHGKVHGSMKAREYYAFKDKAWEAARASFDSLSKNHDMIIIEGAGSPAEINLMDVDIVNMAVAKYAKAPVLLVGDIDKGGVFASLYGTVKLLCRDSRHIRGFIINKFRGDIEILRPGLEMIREKTGKPVIGVLPYFDRAGLPEEDGLSLSGNNVGARFTAPLKEIKIVVVRLQFISNFTDFDPFMHEPDVKLVYSANPDEIESANMVIIPGTKNTVKDLMFLKEHGLDRSIARANEKGVMIVGMCGGYQMLGKRICDPLGVESPDREVEGLGLLDIETNFEVSKTTCRVEARLADSRLLSFAMLDDICLSGYEIHMGASSGDVGLFRVCRLPGDGSISFDGSMKGNCWGTYIHGIFDNDSFRRGLINDLRTRKGLPSIESGVVCSEIRDDAINNLASVVRENIDMNFVRGLLKI
ncbi:MAG TPA: cobyric acid synthase [Dissulfurispiraceae bacterium]|nr:cobyric acid synthase [Dissulfurispiraceae bacterium]